MTGLWTYGVFLFVSLRVLTGGIIIAHGQRAFVRHQGNERWRSTLACEYNGIWHMIRILLLPAICAQPGRMNIMEGRQDGVARLF